MENALSTRRQFVKMAMAAPYLSQEEEIELALRWRDKNEKKALDRICMAHLRLVLALASKFRHYGLNVNDLIQEGHIGLLEAAKRFDPDRQVRFSTYATWWIRASMQDYILRNWSIVRGGTSAAQKALFFNLRRLRAQLSQDSDTCLQSDVHKEIATRLGVSIDDVASMDSRLSAPDTSLNAPISNEDGSSAEKLDLLASTEPLQDEIVEESVDSERRRSWLRDALKVLNERELNIVVNRRLAEDCATLETLGNQHGISKERVRQIECKALTKLKNALIKNETGPQPIPHGT